MSQVVTATFEDGVFKPDRPLDLSPNARVRLIVEDLPSLRPTVADIERINREELERVRDMTVEEREAAWKELERLWEECPIDSGEPRPTRDQLHDRGRY